MANVHAVDGDRAAISLMREQAHTDLVVSEPGKPPQTLGEVDAALVYKTDVQAAGDKVEGIDFPEAAQAVNDYPIAVLKDGKNAATAQAFVDLVRSTEGASVLTAAGFDVP